MTVTNFTAAIYSPFKNLVGSWADLSVDYGSGSCSG